jgi:myosin heavy subunit
MQTCEVLRLGLPTRVSYAHVAAQFRGGEDGHGGLPDEVKDLFDSETDKSFVQAIAWAFGLDTADFKLGLTRIFFRVGKMASLRR